MRNSCDGQGSTFLTEKQRLSETGRLTHSSLVEEHFLWLCLHVSAGGSIIDSQDGRNGDPFCENAHRYADNDAFDPPVRTRHYCVSNSAERKDDPQSCKYRWTNSRRRFTGALKLAKRNDGHACSMLLSTLGHIMPTEADTCADRRIPFFNFLSSTSSKTGPGQISKIPV